MKRLFAVVLVLSGAAVAADKPQNDGYWWANLSAQYRAGYVWGYLAGMSHANTGKLGQCLSFAKDLQQAKFPNTSLKQVIDTFCTYPDDDYDSITVGQFVDGITSFYSDYRNKQLPIEWAMEYIRDEVKGKPGAELSRKLEYWRGCQSAYLSGDTKRIADACKMDESVQK
jgi:hypothetical protein